MVYIVPLIAKHELSVISCTVSLLSHGEIKRVASMFTGRISGLILRIKKSLYERKLLSSYWLMSILFFSMKRGIPTRESRLFKTRPPSLETQG